MCFPENNFCGHVYSVCLGVTQLNQIFFQWHSYIWKIYVAMHYIVPRKLLKFQIVHILSEKNRPIVDISKSI